MYWTPLCANNVNKTCTLLQTTGGKDEPNILGQHKKAKKMSNTDPIKNRG